MLRLARSAVARLAGASVMNGARVISSTPARSNGCSDTSSVGYRDPERLIGCREVVGYGMNGTPSYIDDILFPYPAIRFREISPVYKALKEKERGDWKALNILEKKCLYRISFCQTFSEINAPTGEWKSILAWTLIWVSVAMWFFLLQVKLLNNPLPETFSHDSRVAQTKRLIDMRYGAIEGISSTWDYETNRPKK